MLGSALRTRLVAMSPSVRSFASTLDPKIAAKMKKYQKDLHKETYLLEGTKDKVLYYISLAGVVVGSGWSFSVLWKMANPN